ncbi:ClbS/DfsB family four-helix bundle protein [Shouchella sp. 1P09AA]|uniref:ClbS/DfsB family four-helix bundle protein n=1 Tax=unclassified Shouchella TaxID=2893065 RepID=UPI0039A24D1F
MNEGMLKEKLLADNEMQFEALLNLIKSVPARKRTLSVDISDRDKNFRDVIMHVYEWQAMLERWYREGMDGDSPFMPAPGYKWRNLHSLNQRIREAYQDVMLNQALKKATLSHERLTALIKRHTEEELMTKKYYKWTKTSNLHTYFAANTSIHYKWALKKCEHIAVNIQHQAVGAGRNDS